MTIPIRRRSTFEDLQPRLSRELLPSATYGRTSTRDSPLHWVADSRADAGFSGKVGLTPTITLDATLNPNFTQGGRDRLAGGNELLEVAGVRFNFSRQGFLRVDRSFGFEPWQGERFTRGRLRAFGNVQLFRWLFVETSASAGHAVFYDAVNPFPGRSRDLRLGVTFQPNGQLSQSLGYNHVGFDHESTGARVVTVNIVNAKTTYQFTRALSVRGIGQYDSSRNQPTRPLLQDLLSVSVLIAKIERRPRLSAPH